MHAPYSVTGLPSGGCSAVDQVAVGGDATGPMARGVSMDEGSRRYSDSYGNSVDDDDDSTTNCKSGEDRRIHLLDMKHLNGSCFTFGHCVSNRLGYSVYFSSSLLLVPIKLVSRIL